ncbi:hypothetical protein PGT21_028559 [Puccinia graminis f. sp. tritici]|uniref:Uncharacterized protein n=1 Tax=Puccinia graminis f. sp. tritici TaxID=56615 RepID=A0A5B0M6Z5_PUCGR|nr:hypothetical protein PGT21_028559 [Puccinia graminis f. sp. tritici]
MKKETNDQHHVEIVITENYNIDHIRIEENHVAIEGLSHPWRPHSTGYPHTPSAEPNLILPTEHSWTWTCREARGEEEATVTEMNAKKKNLRCNLPRELTRTAFQPSAGSVCHPKPRSKAYKKHIVRASLVSEEKNIPLVHRFSTSTADHHHQATVNQRQGSGPGRGDIERFGDRIRSIHLASPLVMPSKICLARLRWVYVVPSMDLSSALQSSRDVFYCTLHQSILRATPSIMA